ncbi:HAAS signaling domain-containing protein [Ureibacillus sp. MALMAid1270]|uniref:HAAS signaling domain-containing protein n=1 Tax=Ureibacillus sp. MALMAid1270 TaxID=3411629 RepID=UPI003BA53CA9
MNLIDIYIHEVTRRLPEKSREDIGLELRSTIEDMLPDDYTKEDVEEVLSQLGNPAVLASNYSEKPMHLIGPRYYDVYVTLLKMIIPIAATITLISLLAKYIFSYSESQSVPNVGLMIIGEGIWSILDVAVQTFFWLTLTFAIIERVENSKERDPLSISGKKWSPKDLKNVTFIPKKRAISNVFVFGMLFWTAIWATVYFNADKLVGIYTKGENGLQFVIPAFNQTVLNSYWPLIILSVGLEIALALLMLLKKQWTKNIALLNVLKEVVGTISVIIIVMNVAIFNQEFLTYMGHLFKLDGMKVVGFIQWITIILYPIFAVWNCIDGFLKTKKV